MGKIPRDILDEARREAEVEVEAETQRMLEDPEVRLWAALKIKFEKEFPGQPGRKSLEHEGTTYERIFRKELSNRRKPSRWRMDFIITNPDGSVRRVPDPAEPNRRSDPSRNWGLGRE